MLAVISMGTAIGIALGVSVGMLLPPGINVVAGLLVAWFVARQFVKMSIIEVEEEDETFI